MLLQKIFKKLSPIIIIFADYLSNLYIFDMIQRIQTIYLLVVAVLQSVLFFSNQAVAAEEAATVQNSLKLASDWTWAILIALTAIIPFVTIFLYKKRFLQIRLSIINSLLLLAVQIIVVYYLIQFSSTFETVHYSVTVVSPIVSLILTILAIRFIIKDEARIRALNRIR